jgi:hypothetical protein
MAATTVTKTAAVKTVAKAPAFKMFPPYVGGGRAGQPEATDYRLKPEWIDTGVCIGRMFAKGDDDKRWSIAIFRERQCGSAILSDGLCVKCLAKSETYESDRTYRKYHGTVLEEPLSWLHMLGTAWATQASDSGRLFFKPAEDDE